VAVLVATTMLVMRSGKKRGDNIDQKVCVVVVVVMEK
jgi:hypothetical protein